MKMINQNYMGKTSKSFIQPLSILLKYLNNTLLLPLAVADCIEAPFGSLNGE